MIVKILNVILLSAFLVSTAHAKNLRIAVVNMQRAVSESNAGKKAEAQLKDMKKKLEQELNRKLKEFYKQEAQLRKTMAMLKEPEKRKRADEHRKKFEGLQKRYMEAERELMAKKTKVMMNIHQNLAKHIESSEDVDKLKEEAANLY